MTRRSPSLLTILCEDWRHREFVRRLVHGFGYRNHHLNVVLPAAGAGDGHVVNQYASEVETFRQRNAHNATVLIVVIDADKNRLIDRENQLKTELTDARATPRSATESVVHLIPKRHIETWIRFLTSDESTNEDQRYKPQFQPDVKLIRRAAELFYEWTRPNASPPKQWLPSLEHALTELQRLPKR